MRRRVAAVALVAVVAVLVGSPAHTRVVLAAMKRHGLVLADNGSPWYFQRAVHSQWPSGLLDQLRSIPASAFEAVDTPPLMISSARSRRL